jgi:hypothetical protein
MFENLKKIFKQWLDNAVDDNITVTIPAKYRHLKIKKIIIEVEVNEDEQ